MWLHKNVLKFRKLIKIHLQKMYKIFRTWTVITKTTKPSTVHKGWQNALATKRTKLPRSTFPELVWRIKIPIVSRNFFSACNTNHGFAAQRARSKYVNFISRIRYRCANWIRHLTAFRSNWNLIFFWICARFEILPVHFSFHCVELLIHCKYFLDTIVLQDSLPYNSFSKNKISFHNLSVNIRVENDIFILLAWKRCRYIYLEQQYR